jgi:hypothetical protein
MTVLTERALHFTVSLSAPSIVLAALSCGPRVDPPGKGPPSPPNVVVNATGDGQSVSGHIGPEGGVFELSAGGLRLTLPAGTAPSTGLSLALKRESNEGVPAAAARVGDAFRSTPSLLAPSGKRLELRSTALSPLPGSCQHDGARLALEAPPEAGTGDGTHGPALVWQFRPARADGDRVIAEVETLLPVRAVFLCGVSEVAAAASREGTR